MLTLKVIDANDPVQVEFLRRVNMEIGDGVTTRIALELEAEILRGQVSSATTEGERLAAQVEDMGKTNGNLRSQVTTLAERTLELERKLKNGTDTIQRKPSR